MKTLKIKWQRLVSDGQTCPRCGATEKELEKAFSVLRQSLAHLGIGVILEKHELSISKFKEDPLRSNQIWFNDLLLEDLICGRAGQSPCCDVCGPSECRTVEVDGKVYEVISADLIIKAGLVAASLLMGTKTNKSCCESKTSEARFPDRCQK